MNPILIDFEDSFTLNIASELFRQGVEVDVVNYKRFFDSKSFSNPSQLKVILGPGPGHPAEYLNFPGLENFLTKLLQNNTNRIIGICLGHQILGILSGMQIEESNEKYHGVTVGYFVENNNPCFPNKLHQLEIYVQRYNSLALKVKDRSKLLNSGLFFDVDRNNEVVCIKSEHFLSYQFHPESIGTFYRDEIFSHIKEYLYN